MVIEYIGWNHLLHHFVTKLSFILMNAEADEWNGIIGKIMEVDNSWNNTAGKYVEIYNSVRVRL